MAESDVRACCVASRTAVERLPLAAGWQLEPRPHRYRAIGDQLQIEVPRIVGRSPMQVASSSSPRAIDQRVKPRSENSAPGC